MTDPSASVIEQFIEQLERLSAVLAGDIPSNSRALASLPRQVRLSKETLLTISVLLPKLRTMHEASKEGRRTSTMCVRCEE